MTPDHWNVVMHALKIHRVYVGERLAKSKEGSSAQEYWMGVAELVDEALTHAQSQS